MATNITIAGARTALRAFFLTGLWLAVIILLSYLSGSAIRTLPYGDWIESNFAAVTVALGVVFFVIIYGRWQPFKAIASAARGRNDGERGRLVINIGLTLVIILVVIALVTSLYEAMGNAPGRTNSLWRDPQIVAVAIGLILSVLFVDRWRSLEGKVDAIASDQTARLKDIQETTRDHIELKVGQVVSKAENLSAKLASISEQNPWLEVVTERDIILETESVRGILRSAYNLLNEDKTLHLFEYLDFCSRKGTSLDPRTRKPTLRGTPDDFLEIASFCEIWLGDYALGIEFLRRYVEQSGNAAYAIYPDLARRLLRNGDLPGAKSQLVRLERLVRRHQLRRLLPFLDLPQPLSERYYWYACNVLAIGHAAIGRDHLAERYGAEGRASLYATRFPTEQALLDAERLIYAQDFAAALVRLEDLIAEEDDSAFGTLVHRIVLFERLGEFRRAAGLRKRIEAARATARGDDWSEPPSPGGDAKGAKAGRKARKPRSAPRAKAKAKTAEAEGAEPPPPRPGRGTRGDDGPARP